MTSRSRSLSVAVTQHLQLRSLTQCGSALFDGPADGAKQRFVVEGLGQELDRSRLHRPYRHGDVPVPGDEDDGEGALAFAEMLLEVEPGEVGQRHVQDQAARRRRAVARQEGSGGRVGLGMPPGGADQKLERFEDGDIVVHDEHEGGGIGAHAYHATCSAALMAARSAVSLKGLNRQSTAPCASRCGRTVLSAVAVMKTIGTS
jgi:GNAT superfamily N-acetyltransferase